MPSTAGRPLSGFKCRWDAHPWWGVGWAGTQAQALTSWVSAFQDNEGCPVEATVKDNGNGTYSCSYVPRKPVKHTAMVSWGGVSIPNSPFRVSQLSMGLKRAISSSPWAPVLFLSSSIR